MSVGFAGARGLDDRRRRRLAQEAESTERRPPARPAVVPPAGPQFAASPIESLVRPQIWVNVLLVVLGLSICGGAISLGEWIGRNYPAGNASFGSRGLLIRALRAGLFLCGAQLAAAIHWYRVRSRKDFNARYRIWHFVVPVLLAFGFCAATDAHLVFADWAQARWRLTGDHAESLSWMVPAGIMLLAMIRLLQTEMRGTIGAAPSLWTATIAAVVHAAVVLNAPVPLDDAALALVGRCAMLLWPLGLLLALLLYARSVIYVSNEPCALPALPAPATDEQSRAWLTWWRPRRKSERETPADNVKSAAADRPVRSKPGSASTSTTDEAVDTDDIRVAQPARDTSAPRIPPVVTHAAPAPLPHATAAAPRAPATPAATAPVAKPVHRADPAHDDEDADDRDESFDRGMSKKERKKLRKLQQREQRGVLD